MIKSINCPISTATILVARMCYLLSLCCFPITVNISSIRHFRLNERLHQLIDSQMSNINEICTSRNTPRALDILPKVKTLYLINYHGLER